MEIDFFIKKLDLAANYNVVQRGIISGKSVLICSFTTLLLMIIDPKPRCSRYSTALERKSSAEVS